MRRFYPVSYLFYHLACDLFLAEGLQGLNDQGAFFMLEADILERGFSELQSCTQYIIASSGTIAEEYISGWNLCTEPDQIQCRFSRCDDSPVEFSSEGAGNLFHIGGQFALQEGAVFAVIVEPSGQSPNFSDSREFR